jgi:hypothetical protein
MKNIYKNSKEFPYHISVGVVLLRDDGAIACQHFSKETIKKFINIERDIYTLMRETITAWGKYSVCKIFKTKSRSCERSPNDTPPSRSPRESKFMSKIFDHSLTCGSQLVLATIHIELN